MNAPRMKKQVDAKRRIRKQMEDLDRELYTIETAIDNAFTVKEVDELVRKKIGFSKETKNFKGNWKMSAIKLKRGQKLCKNCEQPNASRQRECKWLSLIHI